MNRGAYIALHLLPAVLLIGATARWPYGYYTVLRLFVCAAALWIAVLDYQRKERVGLWIFALGCVAILFNPIAPAHLTRRLWFFIDLGAAALLAAHWWAQRRRPDYRRPMA
jgi:hypothetical protein